MLFYLGLGTPVNAAKVGGRPQTAQTGADQKENETTMSAKVITKRVVFALAASIMLSGLTAGCRYRSAARSTACKQRGIAFSSQVEGLRRAALEKLTIGATKEDVVRFFAENKFPITFTQSGATGTIYTTGCSPQGCGTDQALIGLRVDLDEAGKVKAKPVVVGMYTDCV